LSGCSCSPSAATHTYEGFARYLRNRARNLLSNDYESGDASWVSGRFSHLNAQIGAYEVYPDQLYGTKAFWSLSLLLRDPVASTELASATGDLQAFEDSLPYEHHKRVRSGSPGSTSAPALAPLVPAPIQPRPARRQVIVRPTGACFRQKLNDHLQVVAHQRIAPNGSREDLGQRVQPILDPLFRGPIVAQVERISRNAPDRRYPPQCVSRDQRAFECCR